MDDTKDGKTWDLHRIFEEILKGMKIAFENYPAIESLSIDTWGVDYVLLNGEKEILPVYAYRDSRTKRVINEVHNLISFERLYEITGSQFQEFNTIYQLYEDKLTGRLNKATDFLFIPEYLMYKLTGVKKHEYTNASTSGMMDASKNVYSSEIINSLGLSTRLFANLDKPKTYVGRFLNDVALEVGGNMDVVLCATHDTASAVEGIPMSCNAPYISSGTWSLLGIKTEHAITDQEAMLANYSNEYGPNYIRFQKNIMGLWIIQCLAKEMKLDFPTMVKMSMESNYLELFDVNSEEFFASSNMKESIINWFIKKNITPPTKDLDIINATYRSLAYSYKVAIDELESITKEQFDDLYIVGGGAKNKYLNELTEKFTKKNVIALPIEATAIGNLLIQMKR
jgi:rhamnulokinase